MKNFRNFDHHNYIQKENNNYFQNEYNYLNLNNNLNNI